MRKHDCSCCLGLLLKKARDDPPPSLCSAPCRAPSALPQHAPASFAQKRSFFRPLASRRARGVRLQGTRYPFRTSCPLAGHRERQSPSKWDHGSRVRCRRGSVWIHLEMSIRVASSVSPLSSEEISTRIAQASDSTRMAQVCEIRLEAWLLHFETCLTERSASCETAVARTCWPS